MEQSLDDPVSADAAGIKIPQKKLNNIWEFPSGSRFHGSSDTSLFSSSLPVLPHEKLNPLEFDQDVQSIDNVLSKLNEFGKDIEDKDSIVDLDQGIGIYLPDEEELFTGITYDNGHSGLPSQLEEAEEYDLFGSGGGMELDADLTDSLAFSMAKASISSGYPGNLPSHYGIPNGGGTVAGEHPLGEHPSRTLFVRNINSNIEDLELRALFEQYGAIRSLYTACKHRGFVMISYYDIRDARNAMRALQNKPLRRRKLDIHFSIPKENPSEKDINQGTLVVFNLDPSVSNDDLRQIFGAYGEVKEIRETPHKRHHKFIEFYDVRAAEAALRALNRSDIAGKRIKLEPSRPGGARRSLMQHANQDLDQDDTRNYRNQVGSPIANSPPGIWAQFSSPRDNGFYGAPGQSPTTGAFNKMGNSNILGLASLSPPSISNSVKIAPIGKDQNRSIHDPSFSDATGQPGVLYQRSPSLPENNTGIIGQTSSSSGTLSSLGPSNSGAPTIGTLNGAQFLWGSQTSHSEHARSSALPTPNVGHLFTQNGRGQGFPFPSPHGSYIGAPNHHFGSAPSIIPFDRRLGFFPDSLQENPLVSHAAVANVGSGRNAGNLIMNMGARTPSNSGITFSSNIVENGIPGVRLGPSQNMGHMFFGSPPYPGNGMESFERARNRRIDNNSSQYQLDLEKIENWQDTRTTLMIKNIPNKYTSKMLLAAIDENHKGTYDFFYLPIDFKNKCNMGYAFINMVSPSHIIPFYKTFNGKRWEKFNSEKVASLAYARIQGKEALVMHFQNSSLMNEDKRCRPILFQSEGLEAGDQEPSSKME